MRSAHAIYARAQREQRFDWAINFHMRQKRICTFLRGLQGLHVACSAVDLKEKYEKQQFLEQTSLNFHFQLHISGFSATKDILLAINNFKLYERTKMNFLEPPP